MGSLYRRGSIWWVKYYANGRPRRESTGTEKETEARRFMKEREARMATGQPILQRADRVCYEQVAKDLREYYQTTGLRNLEEAEDRLSHLNAFFAGKRVATIGSADITAYVAKRQGESASNGTINRDLAVLNRMTRLAYENNKLLRPPVIHKLKEGAPDRFFLSGSSSRLYGGHLPPDIQVAVTIADTFGWRRQSDVLTIELR